jgi:phospholipase/carboxylesterase
MQFEPDAWQLSRPRLGTLETILIQPAKTEPASLVVLCHGFGASGTDLVGMFEEILDRLPNDAPKSAFLFPEAPIDLSDEGMPGSRAWWRLNMAQLMLMNETNSFDRMRDAVPPGIDEARSALRECVCACRSQIKSPHLPVVLGGFSQGAMLTVDTAILGKLENIVGLLVFSGALICESTWRAACERERLQLPFVQSHGQVDPILPIQTGRWLHSFLVDVGAQGTFQEFYGPHTIPPIATEHAARLIATVTQ